MATASPPMAAASLLHARLRSCRVDSRSAPVPDSVSTRYYDYRLELSFE